MTEQLEYAALSAQIRPVVDMYGSGVRPVLYRNASGEPEAVGSCVLLRVGQRAFVITAAHVLDPVGQHGGGWIGTETELVTVAATWHGSPMPESGKRDDDPIDLGFLELTATQQEAFAGCYWFEAADLAFSPPREGDAYVAIGYPWRKAKTLGSERKLDLTAFGYSDIGLPVKHYSRFGYAPGTHVAMHFHRERVVSHAGVGVPMVKPHGMSGGALVGVEVRPSRVAVIQPPLAGILTTWHGGSDKIIVATRSVAVAAHLCIAYPDLRSEFPV